jgi:hypothetical protein
MKRDLQRCFPNITYDVEIKTSKLMRARLIPLLRKKVTQGSKGSITIVKTFEIIGKQFHSSNIHHQPSDCDIL